MKKQCTSKGFTLIELLVVIAILGVLSTMILIFFGSARLRARDARRMSDLKQIQTALELYYTETNYYPAFSGITLGSTDYVCLNIDGFGPVGCSNPFMAQVPKDPSEENSYVYTGASSSYAISAHLEGSVQGLRGDITLTQSGIH